MGRPGRAESRPGPQSHHSGIERQLDRPLPGQVLQPQSHHSGIESRMYRPHVQRSWGGPNRTTVGLKAETLRGSYVYLDIDRPNRTTVGLKGLMMASSRACCSGPNRTTVGLKVSWPTRRGAPSPSPNRTTVGLKEVLLAHQPPALGTGPNRTTVGLKGSLGLP